MKYHPLIEQYYAEIGSNERGYVEDAIGAVLQALQNVVSDEQVPPALREQAAFAAANLLISDYASA